MHVGEAELAALVAVGEGFVVDASEMHEGSLRVVDVDGGVHDVPGIIVRGLKPSPFPTPERRERLMQPSLHLGESGAMVFISGEGVPLVGIIRS